MKTTEEESAKRRMRDLEDLWCDERQEEGLDYYEQTRHATDPPRLPSDRGQCSRPE